MEKFPWKGVKWSKRGWNGLKGDKTVLKWVKLPSKNYNLSTNGSKTVLEGESIHLLKRQIGR